MKKLHIIATLVILFAAINADARVLTLNKNTPSPGQYTSVAAVVAVLQDGDTIYASGAPEGYGDIDVVKSNITIIGRGFHSSSQGPNQNNPQPFKTYFTNITARKFLTLEGLNFSSIAQAGGALSPESVIISNCHFFRIAVDDFSINLYNSILDYIEVRNTNHQRMILVKNCMLKTSIIIYGGIDNLDFENNICYFNDYFLKIFGNPSHFYGPCLVQNNIFYKNSPTIKVYPNASYVIDADLLMQANCAWLASTDPNWLSNNIVADPLFVFYPTPLSYNDPYNYNNDFHLQAGSPCIHAGVDGADIGVYGGSPNYGGFTSTGEPPIPQIRTMTVPANPVLYGQTINVNFSSQAPQ